MVAMSDDRSRMGIASRGIIERVIVRCSSSPPLRFYIVREPSREIGINILGVRETEALQRLPTARPLKSRKRDESHERDGQRISGERARQASRRQSLSRHCHSPACWFDSLSWRELAPCLNWPVGSPIGSSSDSGILTQGLLSLQSGVDDG